MPPKKKASSKGSGDSSSSTSGTDALTLPLSKELSILCRYDGCQSVGVDEAGRGPLAGPVVAAAVALLDLTASSVPPLNGVRDSKTVGEEEREALFDQLIASKALVYGVSIIERDVIDEINIFQATMRGMEQAVAQVQEKLAAAKRSDPLYVLIDGPKVPAGIESAVNDWVARESGSTGSGPGSSSGAGAMPAPPSSSGVSPIGMRVAEAVIKGDSKVYSIAAASLIAKVTRDRIMRKLAEEYPQYGFEIHKGYGVPAHVAAIYKHGPCPAHRRSFRPVKDMVAKDEDKAAGAGAGAASASAKGKAKKGAATGAGGAGAARGRKPAAAAAAAAAAASAEEGAEASDMAAAGASRRKAAPAAGRKPRAGSTSAAAASDAAAAPEAAAAAEPAARVSRARGTTAARAAAANSNIVAAADSVAAAAPVTGRKRRAVAAPSAATAAAAGPAAEAGATPQPAPAAKRGRRASASAAAGAGAGTE